MKEIVAHKHLLPFAALIAILLASCRCEDEQCSAFDPAQLTYIPYEEQDYIRFINSRGDRIDFQVTQKVVSKAYVSIAKHTEFFGCSSPEGCLVTASLVAGSTTQRGGPGRLIMNLQDVPKGYPQDFPSTFTVLDFKGQFYISGGLSNDTAGVLVPNATLGTRQYTNLLAVRADTLSHPAQNIWQVYIAKEGGIVGFRDRQTQSLFYLE